MSIVSREYSIEEYGNLQNGKKYPNPFFDISRSFMPKTIKTLFPFCRIYYYRDPFLNSVMRKLVSYPITDIITEEYETLEDKEMWDDILQEKIRIKNLLVRIGLAYNIFGNAIVSINLTFRRYLQCQYCKTESPIKEVTKRRFSGYKYKGMCPACGKENEAFKIVDVSSTTPKAVRVILWAPERITIQFNEFTGDSKYFYAVRPDTKKDVKDGKLEVVDELPKIFLDAVEKNKKIELDPSNVYHLKQPTLPEDDQGWGKPIILPAMGLIYYMQILRRGNEAIAWEHVVPMRILFPAPSGGDNPLADHSLGQWRTMVEEGIKLWKKDPNHILIAPIPIGLQNMGGDAKALMVTGELKFLEEVIINSLGIPVEFVKGGTTWTGSSISLRIVENGFIQYREDLENFLNKFLIPRVASILKINLIKTKLRRLRMQDDAETKNTYVGLNQTGKISNSTLLEELGINSEADKKRRLDDIEYESKVKLAMATGDAKAQSVMAIEQAKAQAQAEHTYTDEKARIDEKLFEEELANEQASQQYGTGELDPSVLIHKWALEFVASDPKTQQQMYMQMQKTMPTTATMVMKRAQLIQNSMMATMEATVAADNEAKDREVKLEQVKAKKEKTKGQTRGTP